MHRYDRLIGPLFLTCLFSLFMTPARAGDDVRPHAGMLRYPAVSKDQIAFVYAGDIWVAPRSGGVASPLASPPGDEAFLRFSPDGKQLAFVGNYEGNRDIYTIPVAGGVSRRVTYHPAAETLCDFTRDGRLLFFARGYLVYPRAAELMSVSAEGGLPTKLPVPYGANGTISPDGEWLAYTTHSVDQRTWKRYRGGMATDIWLFNLKNNTSKRITDWEGVDTLPMWLGKKVYYLSDNGPEHRMNIWVYDTATGQRKQVTTFKDYDVKWPSIGPGDDGKGEIVFQHGADLMLLDLATEKARVVQVTIPGDRPKLRERSVDVTGFMNAADVSPSGKRVVLEARGDIWTVPAKNGSPRNLTRSSGGFERDPAWSPDGKSIAYFSDVTGEWELYVRPADGTGEPRQLTRPGGAAPTCYRYGPTWSPDGKRIAFSDKTGGMYLCTVESGELKQFDVEPWGNAPGFAWSSDSNWIAYSRGGDNRQGAIWLYDIAGDARHQVTSGVFNDGSPAFDRKGDFLYFASNRSWNSPIYEDLGTTFVYADTSQLLAVPLRKDVKNPLQPRSDEEEGKEKDKEKDKDKDKKDGEKKDDAAADKKDGDPEKTADGASDAKKDGDGEKKSEDEKKDDKKKDEPKPVKIDLEGFERRAILLPVKRGSLTGLSVNDENKLIYVRIAPRGNDDKPGIKIFDPNADEKEEKNVISPMSGYTLTADGKKLLVRDGGQMAVVEARPDQKWDKKVPLDGLRSVVDPRAEWKEMLRDAWRIQRDFFYDPNMHGVNWEAVYKQYEAMLPDCATRDDLSFIIREMISELNVGHAYYFGGDLERQPSVSVGMLGCDFELADGAYRISRILEGAPWDADARGPLSQPGVDVKVGDYLLAVNGAPLDVTREPAAAFQGLADKVVTLTVSDQPRHKPPAPPATGSAPATAEAGGPNQRALVVKLLGGDGGLRFRAWVERNRAYVDEKSGGKVGYVYVPDTGIDGQNELLRQFFGQVEKEALIIDERWNGGGQIPTRFIELLNRPRANYWARRDGKDWPWPPDAHVGPKCMLINGLSGSGGDYFPFWFRKTGLGKLIGTRTWGGLVGISGNPNLMDGGEVTAPTFAFYNLDGTWGIEGHGVDPDIEVIDDPAKMVGGKDPQLDTAVELMLKEIEQKGYRAPRRPAYPDRSGMGIREEDK